MKKLINEFNLAKKMQNPEQIQAGAMAIIYKMEGYNIDTINPLHYKYLKDAEEVIENIIKDSASI
jgi:hypothetical protein